MPNVILVTQISGARDGVHWPKPGEQIEVPDDEAATLVAARYAVLADAAAAPVVTPDETVEVPPVETAESPTASVETATVPTSQKKN